MNIKRKLIRLPKDIYDEIKSALIKGETVMIPKLGSIRVLRSDSGKMYDIKAKTMREVRPSLNAFMSLSRTLKDEMRDYPQPYKDV